MREHRLIRTCLIALICCLAWAGAARAQVLDAWMIPEVGKLKFNLNYDVTYSPDRQVEGQEVDMGYTRHSGRFLAPLWQTSRHELALHGRAAYMSVDTSAILPTSGREFPGDLWDLRLGATYRHKMDRGWVFGGEFTVGSPSDKPFNKFDDTSVSATATLLTPQGKNHRWLFLLNYSNTRDFLAGIPIPGVAYAYTPGPHLNILLGLPVASIRYKPAPKWTLSGLYIYPRTIITRFAYRPWHWGEGFVGFDWTYQRWFLSDRTDDKDRLFFYQKEAKVGLKFFLPQGLTMNLTGSYAFDRLWFQGDDWDDRDQDRINLENGYILSATLNWRF
ncbi:MAG: hypothetical protein KJ720_06055 [Proteobacteria bacterium]|nr:hypothetical protein [Pseudomonadota bacterium]MBU1451719.1 hypothetical protein [Pseudomonadota bacterium]MBU2469670.1 hypothetical protein [Pseudomonadota bacterium]MBU2518062.1 hypothetical protein [Pseudomonadota bacterium]